MKPLDFYETTLDRFWSVSRPGNYFHIDFRDTMIDAKYRDFILTTDRPYLTQLGGLLAT